MRPSPADPRQPDGPLLGFSRMRSRRAVALLLPLLVWVLCCLGVSLLCLESRVCLRTSQSTFVLTYPKLHTYALLWCAPIRVHSIYLTMCMLQTSVRVKKFGAPGNVYFISLISLDISTSLGRRRRRQNTVKRRMRDSPHRSGDCPTTTWCVASLTALKHPHCGHSHASVTSDVEIKCTKVWGRAPRYM